MSDTRIRLAPNNLRCFANVNQIRNDQISRQDEIIWTKEKLGSLSLCRETIGRKLIWRGLAETLLSLAITTLPKSAVVAASFRLRGARGHGSFLPKTARRLVHLNARMFQLALSPETADLNRLKV